MTHRFVESLLKKLYDKKKDFYIKINLDQSNIISLYKDDKIIYKQVKQNQTVLQDIDINHMNELCMNANTIKIKSTLPYGKDIQDILDKLSKK